MDRYFEHVDVSQRSLSLLKQATGTTLTDIPFNFAIAESGPVLYGFLELWVYVLYNK